MKDLQDGGIAQTSDSVDDLPRAVIQYYQRTRFDYRAAWMTSRASAFHFGYYDEEHRHHGEALINANKVLAGLAGIEANTQVLDAGCGVGGSAVWLATHKRALVLGISPVPSQIQAAQQLAEERGCSERTRFLVMDYQCTNLQPESQDVVWALESICHARTKSHFYREAARVIKPGGRLVVAEYMRASRPLPTTGETMLKDWLAGWAIPDIDTEEEHMESAHTAGFMDVQVRDFTPYVRRSSLRLYCLSRIASPINGLLHRLGLRCAVQYGNVTASRLQHECLRRGYWKYGVLTARFP